MTYDEILPSHHYIITRAILSAVCDLQITGNLKDTMNFLMFAG
jgi:hypothetical protein